MNPESQAELQRILSLDVADLTEADIAFLRARRSYLSSEQLEVFASVLEPAPAAPAHAEASETAEAPAAPAPKARKSAKS